MSAIRSVVAALCVLMSIVVSASYDSDAENDEKETKKPFPRLVAVPIVCLPASAFPELPSTVAQYLNEHGLYIPQVANNRLLQRNNVASGKFLGVTETDWAVLAVEGDKCFVLVFPGGRAENVQRRWEERLDSYLQGNGGDTFIFSRDIGTVDPEGIHRYAKFSGEPVPFEVTHDGINDYFVGKASNLWYSQNGEWVALPGAD